MKSLLTSALSCVLSLLLFRFVIATSPPVPAPAAGATAPPQEQQQVMPPETTTTTPSLMSFLFSPALSSLYVTNPTLPTRPLSENRCIFKSVALANDCRFAFDAMQSVESGSQLATALAISKASRQVGPAASQRCSAAADAFYGSGCACEPAVIFGLQFVDIVPVRAKEALLEIAKKCPAAAAPLPRGAGVAENENDKSISLAEAISLLESFLGTAPFYSPPPSPVQKSPKVEKNGGGAPLKGL